MKKWLGTSAFCFATAIGIAQHNQHQVNGVVLDAQTKQPVAAASVQLGSTLQIAGVNGAFGFRQVPLGKQTLQISCIGYQTQLQELTVVKGGDSISVYLQAVPLYLQPLEITALRAGNTAPFSKTNLGKEAIAKLNLGQDLPFLLNQTPSVVVNSDAGNGVGYTGLRIRGTDATRINVTLNGIPYNDAESQGTYFVDLPDFASSLNSIQIQRGVGTSSNGAGAFGGSINLQTNEFNEKAYAELNNSYGSFNTWKNTVKVGSGLINGHFTVDARLSNITSDGYIDRASSKLQSFAFSMAYINKKSSVRFNIFSGKEKTYQAWYGVPEALLATNRTTNLAGTEKADAPYNNQTDNYQQDHYQLFFNHAIAQKWSFNTAVFVTYGRGYYEEYKAKQAYADYGALPIVVGSTQIDSTDLVRQLWLDNYFYGQIASINYKGSKDEVTIGGGWTRYTGKHYGTVVWAAKGGFDNGYSYYNYPALKEDQNIYAKWQHQLTPHLQSFVDVQYRHIYHRMSGFEGASDLVVAKNCHFFNPKAGLTYTKGSWQVFASYAIAGKEPNRDDFKADITNALQSEQLNDLEIGVQKKTSTYNFGATIYYMDYKNQLVQTGKLNDVGNAIRVNVPKSYRLGIELEGAALINNWLNVLGNATFSNNKIQSFTEYLTDYSVNTYPQKAFKHQQTDISFSPSVIASATLNVVPCRNCTVSLVSKYVGKQYLDNTQDAKRSIADYYVQDVRAAIKLNRFVFNEWNIIAQVNNVFSRLYEGAGASYPYLDGAAVVNDNYYSPMAKANFMLGVNIKF